MNSKLNTCGYLNFQDYKNVSQKGTKTIEILSFPSFHARSDVGLQLFPSVVQGN